MSEAIRHIQRARHPYKQSERGFTKDGLRNYKISPHGEIGYVFR